MNTINDTLSGFVMGILLAVPDHRKERTRVYPLPMLLLCALGAILCGGSSFYDMSLFAETHHKWLFELFGVTECPSHDTFTRLFVRMSKDAFAKCLSIFAERIEKFLPGKVVAFDGKGSNRSGTSTKKPAHIVSAWASGSKKTLGVIPVGEKSNEIPAVPELIRLLGKTLAGTIITADALNTQRATAATIIENQADYILAVKENQPGLFQELQLYLDAIANREEPGFTSLDKGHGRLESRRCWQTDKIKDCPSCGDKWVGLKSICIVDRESEDLVTHKISKTRRYFISSLPLNPKLIAESVREHWSIENSCHWVLDVVFGEDQSRARTGNAAVNLRILRSLAMNILSIAQECQKKKISMKGMRFKAAMNSDFLYEILACATREA